MRLTIKSNNALFILAGIHISSTNVLNKNFRGFFSERFEEFFGRQIGYVLNKYK